MKVYYAKQENTFTNLPLIFIDEPGDSGAQVIGAGPHFTHGILGEGGEEILGEGGEPILPEGS